jgi:hypothetical protein
VYSSLIQHTFSDCLIHTYTFPGCEEHSLMECSYLTTHLSLFNLQGRLCYELWVWICLLMFYSCVLCYRTISHLPLECS